jgi:hypothetical protein
MKSCPRFDRCEVNAKRSDSIPGCQHIPFTILSGWFSGMRKSQNFASICGVIRYHNKETFIGLNNWT